MTDVCWDSVGDMISLRDVLWRRLDEEEEEQEV